MSLSNNNKTDATQSQREKYFANDLRYNIKQLKTGRKTDFYQLYIKIQNLNDKIVNLNEKIDFLNQKITVLKKDIGSKVEKIQTRIRKIYKRLFITLGILSTIAIILLIIEFFLLG